MKSDQALPKNDLKSLMEDHWVRYASYVILDRAIPDVVDGLKPVQRRILQTLFKMHDGKLHKVANVAGQTMAYHPHGDAPIIDALVNLANKDFLLDRQGNFGNLFTGDPAAAARYIETRLSEMAVEAMFNPDITEFVPSYDGRNQEPVTLPAKIPLLLMQGAEGIAVGMSTRILPHNFNELLEAQISYLEGNSFSLLPDFPSGGLMDVSEYKKGQGKVKLRAKIEIRDPKTLVITQICHGTTTESLTRSIDEAAKKGKIKIDSINDYTADKVEIEIKLPRGQYAEELLDPLYAFTDCEVSLNSQVVVIKDNLPWETTVDEVLKYNTELLRNYLKRELEIEQGRIEDKIFNKTLEQIFIENRIYKKIEDVKTYDAVHKAVETGLIPFHEMLSRIPDEEDRERLLKIPIRRISLFDINRNKDDISVLEKDLTQVKKDLKNIKQFTINYIKNLLKKYGGAFKRRTKTRKIEELDKKAVATKTIKVGVDRETNYVGTKVKGETFECTNFDKLLFIFADGTYKVSPVPDKEYFPQAILHVGIADKETVFNVIYRDAKDIAYAKRFAVTKFIQEKMYRFIDDEMKLEGFTLNPKAKVEIRLKPKAKQKLSSVPFAFKDVLVKGVSAKGVRINARPVKKIVISD